MKSKFIICGCLIGVVIGTILSFLFPNLLNFGLSFNEAFNKGVGFQDDFYSISGGSVYNSLPILAILFGLIGALCGFTAFKVFHR